MKKKNSAIWKKYLFEFISIFVAVTAAFALNNWNDHRKSAQAENKILTEIYNGLKKDLEDIRLNKMGHDQGIEAIMYFGRLLTDKNVGQDSLFFHYLNLTRDFTSIQNTTGYQTLKSRGLELIENDQLRSEIISLYEYDYATLRKLEEEYDELQFQNQYFREVNNILYPEFRMNDTFAIVGINSPLTISENDRKKLLVYLWKMNVNRTFILRYYDETIDKVKALQSEIQKEL